MKKENTPPEILDRIREKKDELGEELLILTHHYQRSYIVNYVESAAPGSRIIIGTEINLVRRLAAEHPDKTVLPLHESFCPNMYKINLEKLLETLDKPEKNLVVVPADVQARAVKALERMLALPT